MMCCLFPTQDIQPTQTHWVRRKEETSHSDIEHASHEPSQFSARREETLAQSDTLRVERVIYDYEATF